jgi:hypothetical protein
VADTTVAATPLTYAPSAVLKFSLPFHPVAHLLMLSECFKTFIDHRVKYTVIARRLPGRIGF